MARGAGHVVTTATVRRTNRDQRVRNDYVFVGTANATEVEGLSPGEWTWKA